MPDDDEDGKPTIDEIDLGDINVDAKAIKDETDNCGPTETKIKTRDESFNVGDGLD